MKRPLLPFAGFALVFALGLSACSQGPGDRCEVDRDCQSGLLCTGITADSSGGTCNPPPMSSSNDGSAAQDVSPAVDSSADAASDAPTSDAAASDVPTDQTSTDVVTTDAPVDLNADLSTDAATSDTSATDSD